MYKKITLSDLVSCSLFDDFPTDSEKRTHTKLFSKLIENVEERKGSGSMSADSEVIQ